MANAHSHHGSIKETLAGLMANHGNLRGGNDPMRSKARMTIH